MTCTKCGALLLEGAAVCPACNTPVASVGAAPAGTNAPVGAAEPATSPGAAVALEYVNVVKTSSLQALSALKSLAGNPVGALAPTYETLGDSVALRVGVAFGVISVICFLLGGYLMLPSFIREDFFRTIGFTGFIKCLFFALMPFVCFAACSLGVRKAVGSAGGIGGDCFIAGTALLPMSIWALLSGMVGLSNIDFIAILTVFAFCLAILILFAGYTRISKLPERLGTYAVPLVIVVSAWLSSVIGRSIVTSSMPEPSPRYTPTRFDPSDFRFDMK